MQLCDFLKAPLACAECVSGFMHALKAVYLSFAGALCVICVLGLVSSENGFLIWRN